MSWLPVETTTPPSDEPIDQAQAKLRCRVDHEDDDTLIDALTSAARSHVEGVTGTRLLTQSVTLRADCWDDLAALPVAPIQTVSSITYTDTAGDAQTLSGTVYEARLFGLSPAIVLKHGQSFPTIQPGSLIEIEAVAGYGAASDVPEAVIAAVGLVLGDLYANRETVAVGLSATEIKSSATVDNLLCNHRLFLQ